MRACSVHSHRSCDGLQTPSVGLRCCRHRTSLTTDCRCVARTHGTGRCARQLRRGVGRVLRSVHKVHGPQAQRVDDDGHVGSPVVRCCSWEVMLWVWSLRPLSLLWGLCCCGSLSNRAHVLKVAGCRGSPAVGDVGRVTDRTWLAQVLPGEPHVGQWVRSPLSRLHGRLLSCAGGRDRTVLVAQDHPVRMHASVLCAASCDSIQIQLTPAQRRRIPAVVGCMATACEGFFSDAVFCTKSVHTL